jgi:hypothetical protein
MSGHSVALTWASLGQPCQVIRYDVWRAVGLINSITGANYSLFTNLTKPNGLTGTPPAPNFTDSNVKNNTTYTYFVTATNKQGVQSGPSELTHITAKF